MAFAVICKTMDADGVVSYAEVPATECPQEVKLPPYSRYSPRLLPETGAADPGAPGETRFTGYKSIRIERPKAGSSVRNDDGRVLVSIGLEPALQPGHRVTLLVDGRPLANTFDGLSIELSGVQRGDHSLRAAVADGTGKRLIESSPVDFTMRQASRLTPSPATPTELETSPVDGDGAPDGAPLAEPDGATDSGADPGTVGTPGIVEVRPGDS